MVIYHCSKKIAIRNEEVNGMKLKEFRLSKGLTQEELARKLGYTLSLVAKIEQGQVRPSRKFMDRTKNVFPEVVIDDLFF
jgi:transcriptional regulator with XRE-family HTH domain